MMATPGETPVTTPVNIPTVATDVLLLVQVQPTVASLRVVDVPTQIVVEPVIGAGKGLTVTTTVE